ncbi:MAG: PQQ-binding-like beta-propeller repeat protein [Pirellulales bacterium]
MNGVEFLQKLAESRLLSPDVLDKLRGQVTDRTEPARIIDLLVQRKLADRSRLEALLVDESPPADDELLLLVEEEPADDDIPGLVVPPDEISLFEEPSSPPPPPVPPGSAAPPVADATHRPPTDKASGRTAETSSSILDDEDAWPSPLDDVTDERAYPSTYSSPRRRQSWWPWSPGDRGRRKLSNSWDSPLILWGGGSLIVLMALLVALVMYLVRGSGDELATKADEAYQAQNYPESIQLYQRLAESYPKHAQASHARVRSRLAQLRQAIEREKNFAEALQVAQTVLPELSTEANIDEAHDELASILPALMEGLVEQAAKSGDVSQTRQLVEQAQQAMQLIDNPTYIPSSRRQERQAAIDQILANLDGARRTILQDERLQATLTQLNSLAAAGDFPGAHQAARSLVLDYPALATNAELLKAWQGLAVLEVKATKPLEEIPTAVAEPRPEDQLRRVVISHHTGPTLSDVPEQATLTVLVRGAVYGLQTRTGQVQWRRFVGFAATVPPLQLSGAQPGVAIVDPRSRELLWCDVATGRVLWRVTCPSEPWQPTAVGDVLIVPCRAGQVIRIQLADGKVTHAIQLPLPLASGGAIAGNSLLVPADYATIYQLSTDQLTCEAALPLGHLPGAIAVPPVTVGDRVAFCQNVNAEQARIMLLSGLGEGSPAPAEFPLPGRVLTPPSADGTRLLVVSDLGAISLIDVGPVGSNSAPKQIAATTSPRAMQHLPRAILHRNLFWTVEQRLQQFRAVASQGRVADQGSVLSDLQPAGTPLRFGNYLFIPAQLKDFPQVSILAFQLQGEELATAAWRTDVGLPPVAPVTVSNELKAIDVITGNGDWYRISGDAIRSGRSGPPAIRLEAPGTAVQLGPGEPLAAQQTAYPRRGPKAGWALATHGESPQLQVVNAELNGDQPASQPGPSNLLSWQGGLLYAGARQIHWLDAATGQPKGAPFVPPVDLEGDAAWTGLVQAPDQPGHFLVADNAGHVYRAASDGQSGSALQQVKQNSLELPFFGPAAAGKQMLWLLVGPVQQAKVCTVSITDLDLREQWELKSQPVIGPVRVGDQILVADELGGLHLWNAESAEYRTLQPNLGPAVGQPLWHDNLLWVAFLNGQIAAIDVQQGTVVKQFETRERLSGGPIVLGSFALGISGDGTLCVTELNKKD